jgi:hypothetical protein
MIDAKVASLSAYNYLDSLQDVMGGGFQDIRLEEVELTDDKDYWLITLGYDLPDKFKGALGLEVFRREYKLFRVNAQTGEVESMKIRSVSPV